MTNDISEPVNLLGYALDEVWRLRRLLAFEARMLETTTDYKTFPKSRRGITVEQITRMRDAALGESIRTLAELEHGSLDEAMTSIGASTALTRAQFENEVQRRAARRGGCDGELVHYATGAVFEHPGDARDCPVHGPILAETEIPE